MEYFNSDKSTDDMVMFNILEGIDFYSGTERKRMLITPRGTGSMLYGYTWRGYLSPTKNRTKSIYEGLYQTKCNFTLTNLKEGFTIITKIISI